MKCGECGEDGTKCTCAKCGTDLLRCGICKRACVDCVDVNFLSLETHHKYGLSEYLSLEFQRILVGGADNKSITLTSSSGGTVNLGVAEFKTLLAIAKKEGWEC